MVKENSLDNVITISEAMSIWGVTQNHVRRTLYGYTNAVGNEMPAKIKSSEWRKSGKTVLILKSALERVYGKEKLK